MGPAPPLLLAEPEPAALADAILRVVRDPGAAARRAQAACALVGQRFGWDRVVDRLETIYGARLPLAA